MKSLKIRKEAKKRYQKTPTVTKELLWSSATHSDTQELRSSEFREKPKLLFLEAKKKKEKSAKNSKRAYL